MVSPCPLEYKMPLSFKIMEVTSRIFSKPWYSGMFNIRNSFASLQWLVCDLFHLPQHWGSAVRRPLGLDWSGLAFIFPPHSWVAASNCFLFVSKKLNRHWPRKQDRLWVYLIQNVPEDGRPLPPYPMLILVLRVSRPSLTFMLLELGCLGPVPSFRSECTKPGLRDGALTGRALWPRLAALCQVR